MVAGCSGKPETAPAVVAQPAPAGSASSPQIPASWLGKWNGPEGTYLDIAEAAGAYTVTISNLDGPRSFAGTPAADGLGFERDGVAEVIRATDGPGTGMKWLADKTHCLSVKMGEGFCRD